MIRVGIVGVGPRGASVLERLVANARVSGKAVDIHLVDPYPPGPGAVWRADQPSDLLMNVVASETTLFTDDSVRCAGPIRPGPNLYEWADGLQPWAYPSRALYSRYLSWFIDRILNSLPAGVRVNVHKGFAVGLDDAGPQVLHVEGVGRLELDAVVLAQGHVGRRMSPSEQANADFAARHGLFYSPPANPLDVDWAAIPAGEPVLVRGLGLNFFDAVAMLTTVRGGLFEPDNDRLRYRPSGGEPVLYVGSRRGVPLRARAEIRVENAPVYRPRFFDAAAVAGLRARAGSLRFRADVWPLLEKELGGYGIDCDTLDRPLQTLRFADRDELTRWMLEYLDSDVAAALNPADSPLKTMTAALRDLRGAVRTVVSHRGLTGSSYRDELEGWFAGFITLVSSGPPASRIAELAALARAGLIRFVGPGMTVTQDDGRFTASSPTVDGPAISAQAFVEARLPEPDLATTTDPLLSYLRDRGAVRRHVIPDPDGDDYVTGAVDVTEVPFRVINSSGVAHPRRFAFGIPTEGVQWTTAIGARPGVNSALLRQSDAIARAVLELDLERGAS